ncbi:NAD/NADP octopine/nopaline dehydrogenase family protein [Terrarubrum flagellatum]|uniref:NAD/NADP octopine/nopaline dehydrogenase family protein n=1 Tax=Terrirubrum flagellatum TaxID=2895980 RepID=UPI003144F139
MKVGILGAGGVAFGYAAFLREAGHQPRLWSPSGRGVAPFLAGEQLTATGAVSASFMPDVATDPAFVADMDALIVAVPGYGYRSVFNAIVPHVRAGATIIISAHLSMAARYLTRRLAERNVETPVLAWGTTALMGRKTSPSSVEIGGVRREIDLAAANPRDGANGLAMCVALFGERFKLHDDLMAIQLGNLNPPIHLASALCNFTRIERGENWANYDGITPAVARLVEALDRERLALAAAFGVEVRSVERHYQLTFGFPPGESLAAMAAEVHRQRGGPPGPKSLQTRFVIEDVPFGIVPLVRIGRRFNMPMTLHEAGVKLFDALYGCSFEQMNDLLEADSP